MLLTLLVVFIAENSHIVTISFLGATGRLSLGLAMLISALVGTAATLLVGTTRIVQLRQQVGRAQKETTR